MRLKQLIVVAIILLITTSVQAQTKSIYEIAFVLDESTPEVNQIVEQIKSEIIAVVGEDAEIRYPEDQYLFNGMNIENARQNYNELVNGSSDIVIALGPIMSRVVSEQDAFPKPVIIFGNALTDLVEWTDGKSPGNFDNLVYLVTGHSFKDDIESFRDLVSFDSLGIAVDNAVSSALPIEDFLNDLVEDLDITYKFITFDTMDGLVSELEGIDALYLNGGFLMNDEEIKYLSDALIERGIPSFTATSVNDVELGLMATNQVETNFNLFYRRIALNVEAIINGAIPGSLPASLNAESGLTVNFNTAQKLDVPLRYSMIANTNVVGDFSNVNAETVYNLEDVVNEVIDQNLDLQSAQKEIELATQDVKEAKSNYLPDLTATATSVYVDPEIATISNGQNPEYSADASLTLTQTIYSPDASANVGIQRELKSAQIETFNANELDAIFDGANAYFNALLFKANLQIAQTNLNITKRSLQLAEQNFESGQSGKADVLQFRSQLADNTQNLVEAVNLLNQAFFALNQVLNQPLGREIDVEDAILGEGVFENYDYERFKLYLDSPTSREPFIAFLIQEAKKNAPELKSLDYILSATQKSYNLASRTSYLPTLGLRAQYNTNFDRSGAGSTVPPPFEDIPTTNYNVGVSLSLPIFQRSIRTINKQTAQIQLDQLAIDRENLELRLENSVRNLVLQVINQIANIELSQVSVNAAEESLELIQESYITGAVNWTQLIDSQEKFISAQLANATAVYNYMLQTIQLERVVGYYFILHTDEENQEFEQRFLNFLATYNNQTND